MASVPWSFLHFNFLTGFRPTGTYVVLFCIALAVLILRSRAMQRKRLMIFVTCFLFFLCSVHFSLNFNNVYNGLVS